LLKEAYKNRAFCERDVVNLYQNCNRHTAMLVVSLAKTLYLNYCCFVKETTEIISGAIKKICDQLVLRVFVAVCCSVLQCVCSVFAVCCSVLQCTAACCCVLQCVAECYRVLQCIAVCCSVLQCVAVCCSVLQCVAV